MCNGVVEAHALVVDLGQVVSGPCRTVVSVKAKTAADIVSHLWCLDGFEPDLQAFEILVHALSILGSLLLCDSTFDYGVSISSQVGHPVTGRAVASLQTELLHFGDLCCCLRRHCVYVYVCICDAEYVLEKNEANVCVFVVGMIYALARKR
jgi:hypothetical protein